MFDVQFANIIDMRLKTCLIGAFMMLAMHAGAQQASLRPAFSDNLSVEAGVGAATPLKGTSFIGGMRPAFRLSIDKMLTPAFGIGIESEADVNTSRWPKRMHSATGVDEFYAGMFGSIDLLRLSGQPCEPRRWGFGLRAGAGWGHLFATGVTPDRNYFGTNVGLFVRYDFNRRVGVSLTPTMAWNMSDARTRNSSASYNANYGRFGLFAALRYSIGNRFECPPLYDASQIVALNAQINSLRADRDKMAARADAANVRTLELEAKLAAAEQKHADDVVKEVAVDNRLNTEFAVFFLKGSALVTPDQMPNVSRIASYLKAHPSAVVDIRGYASSDGDQASNLALARKRAESIRDALVGRLGISPMRVTAVGGGIGHLFDETSWNRVCLCTIKE